MEEELEFISDFSDDDEDIVLPNERVKPQDRKLSKKGSTTTDDDRKRKSSFDKKPARKTRRKLKTAALLSIGLKNRTKKTKDKKLAKKGSKDVWERVDVTKNESSSLEDVGGEDAANTTHDVDSDIRTSRQNVPRANRNWKTASHAVDWALNPKRRIGELKPVKKKTKTKSSGGKGAKKQRNHDDVNVLNIVTQGDDCTLVSSVDDDGDNDNDDDDDDDDGIGTDCEQSHERRNDKRTGQNCKNETAEETGQWSDDPHHVDIYYSDDFTDDDTSVASSLDINGNGRNDDDMYGHRRYRRHPGVQGVGSGRDEGAKRTPSSEMRRQRLLGIYGAAYAVRWVVSPRGRVEMMTPDREAMSALRRNLPPTPETTMAKTAESNKKAEKKPALEICETVTGIYNHRHCIIKPMSYRSAPFHECFPGMDKVKF